jgi:hypothetical protein
VTPVVGRDAVATAWRSAELAGLCHQRAPAQLPLSQALLAYLSQYLVESDVGRLAGPYAGNPKRATARPTTGRLEEQTMPFAMAIPLAISAIKALLKFRGQVDVILSLKEATTGLPFALPPAPTDDAPHLEQMLAFFRTEQGKSILAIKGLQDDFAKVAADPRSETLQGPRTRLFRLYYEASDIPPEMLGPRNIDRPAVIRGPSTEMRLAYYVVESHRLSRNPPVTRLLMATADTLLEVAGENASLFIAHPQTQGLVRTFLEDFAGTSDFDDASLDRIFKKLLSATIMAALDNPGRIQEKPAITPLFAALKDVREELGDDFVAEILSVDRFETLLSTSLTHVAQDPAFLTKDELAQQVLAATLKEVGHNVPQLTSDPRALLGVLEVGLTAMSDNVAGILDRTLAGKPLLAALLTALAQEVATHGPSHQLFSSIADGAVLPAFYKAALQAIAVNPDLIAHQDTTKDFLTTLVSGMAEAVAAPELSTRLSPATLQRLACKSLELLCSQLQLSARATALATKALAAAFQASAMAVPDGSGTDDLLTVAQAALKTASDHGALVEMNETLADVLISVGKALSEATMRTLLTPASRTDTLIAALQVVAANPTIWRGLREKDLVQPMVQGILQALSRDPAGLLSGPVLVDAIRRVLLTAARRGKRFIDREVNIDDLTYLSALALKRAEQENGRMIDGENLPTFLERVVSMYLKAPFPITQDDEPRFGELVNSALTQLDTA